MNFLEQVYTGKNQWYWYVLSLLIIFIATQIGSLPLVGYIFLEAPQALLSGDISSVTSTNLGLALMLLSFVVGFFAIFFCVKYIHGKRALDIVTSRPKIDWNRFFFGAGIWVILSIITFALTFLTEDNPDLIFRFEPSKFFVMLAVALLMFPFQTSFEELMFRGYLMQWSYLLFKNKWAAIVLTGVIFGLMHSANPEVKDFGMLLAMPQYILMGLLLGYIAVQDNGLELSLGIHAANNILSAITITSPSSTLQTHALFIDPTPSASGWDSVFILISGLLFIWISNRKYQFIRQNKSVNISLKDR